MTAWGDMAAFTLAVVMIWRRFRWGCLNTGEKKMDELIQGQQGQTATTGSSVVENLAGIISEAAGSHSSPALARGLSLAAEALGLITDEAESALKGKIDVSALNAGLNDLLNGGRQAERGIEAAYRAIRGQKAQGSQP